MTIARLLLMSCLAMAVACSMAKANTIDDVLQAIRRVETGGSPNNGQGVRGDQGSARGPFQIHYVYWHDSGVPGKYADCDDYAYSRHVVLAYWQRYCPDALKRIDAQRLARVHNGGPQGHNVKATIAYWHKVRRNLIHR